MFSKMYELTFCKYRALVLFLYTVFGEISIIIYGMPVTKMRKSNRWKTPLKIASSELCSRIVINNLKCTDNITQKAPAILGSADIS